MSVIRQGVWDWGGGGGSRMSRFRTENNYLGWRELGKQVAFESTEVQGIEVWGETG